MGFKAFYKKHENFILAAGLLMLLILFTALRYDFTYELNDDVMLKDILSGVYTGVPESRNIQMLYPMSLFLSVLGRIFPKAPVYGIFLCICQFGCFFLLVKRSLSFREKTGSKLFMALFEGIIITGLFLYHLVLIQYTVTSALLAATAAFLFFTSDGKLPPGRFIKKNAGSILLAAAAYMLRPNMLLLMLPFLCAAGVLKWIEEKPVLAKRNFIKYFSVFGGICALLIVSFVINGLAYGGKEWKTFREFFDSRTELYDYQGVPSYEGNEALYETLGITQSEQNLLLARYDFGMEEKVDAAMLDTLSSYQEQINEKEHPPLERLKESVRNYIYRTLHREPPAGSEDTDYPYNLMVILGYIAVFLTGIWNAADKEEKLSLGVIKTGAKLVFLGLVRTALWLYILLGNRYPARITHSLYLMELCILFAMLLTEYAGIEKKMSGKIKASIIFPVIMCLTAVITVPESVARTDREYEGRGEAGATELSVKEYCRQHPENFYFRDVYSAVSETLPSGLTVPYADKLFRGADSRPANYDIMGGWVVKSPLYDKKMEYFGITSMRDALLYDDKVFLMAELSVGTDWVTGYYEDQGLSVQAERVGMAGNKIGVYRLSVKSR